MSSEVTLWLERLEAGDSQALDHLVPLLYEELRRIARGWLRREVAGRTLQTTGLVNEAYLKLRRERKIRVEDRNHFFAVAGNVMRRILIDAARHRHRKKRGGGVPDISFDLVAPILDYERPEDLESLDDALERLAKMSPRACRVVEHRFFAGRTIEETALLLEVSEKTVRRDWITARAWLAKELDSSAADTDQKPNDGV